ncbi:unnamed protein product [Clonostachys byssicola]|uniref:Major facilitator superfamily (MFS) profile domain-containing protein n=1 Tax=Clonostachys byssicola TaxID=160290 RepID=A0A9N9UCE4_9HYPO|nr:unnamed protein product [Clonostachys byssicola]
MSVLQNHAEDSCLKNQQDKSNNISDGNNKEQPPPALRDKRLTGTDQSTDEEGEVFPEGGLTAWLVVFGAFCALVSVYGLINTSAVFESYFKEHQLKDHSHSKIGWIFSLYLFLVFLVGVQVGPIFDRYGPRLLVAVGCVLAVASLMFLSVSKTYTQIILSYSVVGGIGGALLNAPAYGAVAHFFNVRRGVATGIAATAGSVGGIVFPLLLRHLLGPNGVGFAWSCRILGFILLGLSVPANLFIKSRSSIQMSKSDQSQAVTLWPDLTVFRDRRFAASCLGYFFMEWGLFVPLTYIISYGVAYGISASQSSLFLVYLNAGSALGRFLPGFVADKVGRFNVIIITIAFCAITVLGLWLPCNGSPSVLTAFSVLFGIVSGSNLSLLPVCLGQFCDARDYGRYFATATMAASFGTLTSVPIAGALIEVGDKYVGWMSLILFAGCSYTVALISYVSARVMSVGWQPSTKF